MARFFRNVRMICRPWRTNVMWKLLHPPKIKRITCCHFLQTLQASQRHKLIDNFNKIIVCCSVICFCLLFLKTDNIGILLVEMKLLCTVMIHFCRWFIWRYKSTVYGNDLSTLFLPAEVLWSGERTIRLETSSRLLPLQRNRHRLQR